MKGLLIILIPTFLIGFLAGIFVYFISGASDVDEVPESEIEGVEIIANTYGGCELFGCSSYRIVEDGDYIYIKESKTSDDDRFEDSLSDNQIDELIKLSEETDLEEIEESYYEGDCPAYVDGISYEFKIMVDGESYKLDSCENDLASSDLFNKLIDYFRIFYLIHVEDNDS